MEINFVGGYSDQQDGIIFVFMHKEKHNFNLFKVATSKIPYLKMGEAEAKPAETSEAQATTPEVPAEAEK